MPFPRAQYAGPVRIVSLVPSLTELVAWFGLEHALVGRTRFCVEPQGLRGRVPVVGGTKDVRVERVIAAHPDLVLANREENRREDVERLRDAGLEVLLTDPATVPEATAMIRALGARLGVPARAETLAGRIEAELALQPSAPGPRLFVPVWKEPLMGLGSDSYGHDLLARAGATNILEDRPRYPELSLAEVVTRAPDLILLPDEPYPFKTRDLHLFAAIAPARLVDGKLLWWYGPRIPEALSSLRKLFQEVGG